MSSDTIFVTGLLIHARHGVMPHEGKVGQRFVLDLELSLDLAAAARSDKVVDTVSYDRVVEIATKVFTARTYRLIEAAAGAVADATMTKFPRITAIRVTVRKPHAPIAAIFADAGVTVVRKRHV